MDDTTPARILLIEDEPPIRRFLDAALSGAGYVVEEAATAQEGLRALTRQPPDAVLLDLGLPDRDGLDVLRQLREWSAVPVIVLSARGMERDKVAALDSGADDYLTKPFGVSELLARLRVALRHAARTPHADLAAARFEHGDLVIDLASRKVLVRGEPVKLTKLEFKLLTTLVQNSGKVLTHRHLLTTVWGPDAVSETHYLRVFMANLRKKIEVDSAQPRYLLTEQGVGYRFAGE